MLIDPVHRVGPVDSSAPNRTRHESSRPAQLLRDGVTGSENTAMVFSAARNQTWPISTSPVRSGMIQPRSFAAAIQAWIASPTLTIAVSGVSPQVRQPGGHGNLGDPAAVLMVGIEIDLAHGFHAGAPERKDCVMFQPDRACQEAVLAGFLADWAGSTHQGGIGVVGKRAEIPAPHAPRRPELSRTGARATLPRRLRFKCRASMLLGLSGGSLIENPPGRHLAR